MRCASRSSLDSQSTPGVVLVAPVSATHQRTPITHGAPVPLVAPPPSHAHRCIWTDPCDDELQRPRLRSVEGSHSRSCGSWLTTPLYVEKRVSKGLAGLGVGLAYRTAILALARSLAPPGNFARTFGAELAAKLGGGSAHWSQLWICVVALPVGGVVAVYAYDVLIAGRPLMAASTGPGRHRNCDGEAGLTDRTAGCRCGLRPARGRRVRRFVVECDVVVDHGVAQPRCLPALPPLGAPRRHHHGRAPRSPHCRTDSARTVRRSPTRRRLGDPWREQRLHLHARKVQPMSHRPRSKDSVAWILAQEVQVSAGVGRTESARTCSALPAASTPMSTGRKARRGDEPARPVRCGPSSC